MSNRRRTNKSFDSMRSEADVEKVYLGDNVSKIKISIISLFDIKTACDKGCYVDYYGGYEQLLVDIEREQNGVL